MEMNWKNICNKIDMWEPSLGDDYGYAESNPFETIECAAHGGGLIDLDWMVYVKELIGFPISWDLYRHIDNHYDGSLMELDGEDIPALKWLIHDYAVNGELHGDIWKNYDFYKHKDVYGFCGWHKRVMEGIA